MPPARALDPVAGDPVGCGRARPADYGQIDPSENADLQAAQGDRPLVEAGPADGGVHHGACGEGEQERLSVHEAEGRRGQAGVGGGAVGQRSATWSTSPITVSTDSSIGSSSISAGGAGVALE
ncbi:MAG: hypothetical protein H7269_04390 [Cellulomonas sp.]|nr:hypothetical protein [Cellulomonas sp.]